MTLESGLENGSGSFDKKRGLDLIKDSEMSDLNKTLLLENIIYFTYCNLPELQMRMQGKTDLNQYISSVSNRFKTLKKLESVVDAFDRGILSEDADWYFDLSLRISIIKNFIEKTYEIIDFSHIVDQREKRRRRAEELIRQDEASDPK